MRLPITAWTSIAHQRLRRIPFAGMAVLLWVLDASLQP